MEKKRKYTYLQPSYYKDFKCSGSECSCNCCNYNWRIDVDKETYKKYRAVKEPKEFAEMLNKYVKRNRTSPTDSKYAKLNQKYETIYFNYKTMSGADEIYLSTPFSEATCIFQDKNGLCEIHKNLGYEWLSNTCKNFPRNINNIFGNYERSMVVGCEEVSKLLYNLKDGLSFEIIEQEEIFEADIYIYNNKNILFANYFDRVRLICIQILQNKEYTIDERMIINTIFLFKIDEFYNTNNYKELDSYLDTFLDNIYLYNAILESDSKRQDILFKIILEVINGPMKNIGTINLIQILREIEFNILKACSIGKTEEEHNLRLVDGIGVVSYKYEEYKRHTEELMKDKEYYIENIFVNTFFTMGFPYNGINSIKECVTIFVWDYIYYKCLLNGYLVDKQNISEEELHTLSTIFGRGNADQYTKLKIILDAMKESGLDNLAILIVLIKSA